MKTRSSSGVGQKIDLSFNVDTLRIEDLGEEGEEAPTATQGGSAILDALKRTNNGEQHTGDDPDDGAPVKKIRAEADSTKLRAFINNLGDE